MDIMIPSLLQQTGMWRASSFDFSLAKATPTGFAELDGLLAGGGWPAGGIGEILYDNPGIGELRIFVPAMARLSRTDTRWILWVSPPHVPYAPALARADVDLSKLLVVKPKNRVDRLWVMEKALASGSCSFVLAWPGDIRDREIRRLQVAAKDNNCLGMLFRRGSAARQSSPAELRLQVEYAATSVLRTSSSVKLRILKRRGGWPTDFLKLDFGDDLNRVTPDYADMPVARPRENPVSICSTGYDRYHEPVNDAKL